MGTTTSRRIVGPFASETERNWVIERVCTKSQLEAFLFPSSLFRRHLIYLQSGEIQKPFVYGWIYEFPLYVGTTMINDA